MARAAASTSLSARSVISALAGLTSTATRAAAGTNSRRSSQPLGRQLARQEINPSHVATGAGEAGDKAKPDRIISDKEGDWDGRGCGFGRQPRRKSSARGDNGDLTAH